MAAKITIIPADTVMTTTITRIIPASIAIIRGIVTTEIIRIITIIRITTITGITIIMGIIMRICRITARG